jgi:hypothetical protein
MRDDIITAFPNHEILAATLPNAIVLVEKTEACTLNTAINQVLHYKRSVIKQIPRFRGVLTLFGGTAFKAYKWKKFRKERGEMLIC